MKKTIQVTCLVTLLLPGYFSLQTSAQIDKKNNKMLEHRFTCIKEINDGELTASEVLVACALDSEQSVQNNGISFSLTFSNTSSKDLNIVDPLDLLKIDIKNEEGWPLHLPPNGHHRIKVCDHGHGHDEVQRPFVVESLICNTDGKDLTAIASNNKLQLSAKTAYTYTIRIEKLRLFNPDAPNERTIEIMDVPAGKYKICIKASIILVEAKTVYSRHESPELSVTLSEGK